MNQFTEQNQSHSADDDIVLLSSSNDIYLSPDKDFRRDNVRSMSVIDDIGMRTRRYIKRNGTLPNLSKGSYFYFYQVLLINTISSSSIYQFPY